MGKSDSTGTYSYLCDGASPGAAVLYDGHAVYTAGLSETRAGVSSFYDFDQMGNLWTLDGSSKNQEYYQDTTGFGTNTATGGTDASPFKFGGENGCQTDADTGLVLMGHRYYDTRIGRFITQDPAGDGDNWYAYAGNSPTNNIDPTGLLLLWPGQPDDTGQIPGFQGQPSGYWPDGSPYFVPNGGPESDANLNDPSSWAYDLDSYGWPGPHGPSSGGDGDVTGPSAGEDVVEGFGVGISAVASAATFHLWDGGAAKNDPSFATSRGLADIGVLAASAAFGGEEAEAATGCFTKGTPVQTKGKPQEIQDIHAGQLVATRSLQTGQTEYHKVVRTFRHLAQDTITVEFADAKTGQVVDTLTATPEHPFYVPGQGMTALGSLGIGTLVVTRAGPPVMVKSLVRQHSAAGVMVYNIEVEGDHTYFVGSASGGEWVHNICTAEVDPVLGVVKGKIISFKQALERIRNGLDVFAGKRGEAKALGKAASGINRVVGPEIHGDAADGFFEHFHPDPRNGSHIFYP